MLPDHSSIAMAGINAVQLVELSEPPDRRLEELVPVVTHSAKRRIEKGDVGEDAFYGS